jgi:polysaccharide export outer membrane protein
MEVRVIKKALIAINIFILVVPGMGFGQQAAPYGSPPATASGGPVVSGQFSQQPSGGTQALPPQRGGASTTQMPSPTGQQMAPQQADMFQRLSPAQQQAIQSELGKTGGTLTPQMIESLKSRPEFLNTKSPGTPEAKDMLEEAGKKPEIKGAAQQRYTGKSLFERVRAIGKYQDISLDLKPFGYDFFQGGAEKAITERKDVPVPTSYVVGPGDEIRILMWGRINANYSLLVEKSGMINIPQIGPVMVAGMTFDQMSRHLIKQAEQFVGANIDITMGTLKSIPIFVLGDVARPGSYTVGSFSTIMDALLAAGGPSDIGTMRNIQLKRKDMIISHFDLYDLLLKGDKSKDLTLQAGDVVFVPVTGPVVGVAGNVKRPAIYELKDKNDLSTLFDLAGGIIPTAYIQQIQVERVLKNERQVVIDLDDRNLTKAKGFRLQDVDLVKVFNIVDKATNTVFLSGNVKRPGKYEYRRGMTIRDLLKDEQDLLPETYLDYAVLTRIEPPNGEPKLSSIDLRRLFSTSQYNIDLKPGDSIFIFSKWFFKDRPYVFVEGEVRGTLNESQKTRTDDQRVLDEMRSEGTGMRREIWFGTTEIGQRTLDELQRTGITRLDDPRIKEMNRGDIDHRTLDELRKVGITRLDDPRITEVRRQAWATDAADIDQRTLNELRKAGITRLDDPRIAELRSQSLTQGQEIDLSTLDELSRMGIVDLSDPRIAETQKRAAAKADKGKFVGIPLTDNMTVRDAILGAGGLTRNAYLDRAELYRTDDVTKDVSLLTFNVKKALEGDLQNNIVLKSNDRIVIQSLQGFVYKKTVSIDGEVLKPGDYPYSSEMTIKDLVFAAGNVLEGAYLGSAEVTSMTILGDSIVNSEHRNVNLKKALEGDPAYNVKLKPYDRLTIKRMKDWRREVFVSVNGEVRFPGKFVTKKGEKLSSLIERAGGYTNDAYLRGAFFTRAKVREMQRKSLEDMILRMERETLAEGATVTASSTESIQAKKAEIEQRQRFIESLKRLRPTGRMTVYLAHLRLLKGSEYDIELEEGDNLYIPTKNSVVNVTGAVMTNASFVHSDRMDWKDYIQMAGGYSRYADRSNIFVMKVDGTARKVSSSMVRWNPFKNRWEAAGVDEGKSDIEAGDSIIVPEKLERVAWLREFKDITQIVANIGLAASTVAVLYKTLKNN